MKPQGTVRLVLADDHRLVRAGLRMLLAGVPGVLVQGEAASGEEALRLCAGDPPDLVLMDIAMPGMGGLQALREIRTRHPATRVLMLSMLTTEEHVLQALRLGAAGYLLKDAAPAELELSIAAVMRGESWLSPSLSHPLVDAYLAGCLPAAVEGDMRQQGLPLTTRQTQVLRLLAEGCATKEIAYQLGLSVKTVETHRAQIMERLAIHDLASLVRYAIRNGLVEV